MAFPESVILTSITTSGGVLATGQPLMVRLTITPGQSIIHEATGMPVLAGPVGTEWTNGELSVEVPNDSQAGFIDEAGNQIVGWGYRVKVERRIGDHGVILPPIERDMNLLEGQESVDFDLIPAGSSITPTMGDVAVVTSVNGLTGAVIIEAGGGGPISWDTILDKPDTFPPSNHGHNMGDVAGLGEALTGMQPAGDYVTDGDPRLTDDRNPTAHGHQISDVEGLQDALDTAGGGVSSWDDLADKPAAFPPAAHTHAVGDVDGLQSALDGKQPSGDYVESDDARLSNARPPLAHTHTTEEVTGMVDALADKVDDTDPRLADARAPLAHEHGIDDVEGLQSALDAASAAPAWGEVTGKPSAYPPAVHGHAIGDVAGLQDALDSIGGDVGAVSWGGVTDKPTEFPPSAHDHQMGDIEGLFAVLDGKVETTDPRMTDPRTPLTHSHEMSDVSGLPSALAGKSNTGHGHPITEVSGLQAALDGKQSSGDYATTATLTSGLAGKANTTHAHSIANVTGLQGALDGKAAAVHTHGLAEQPAGTTITRKYEAGTGWPPRGTTRTDITVQWLGGTEATPPTDGVAGADVWIREAL